MIEVLKLYKKPDQNHIRKKMNRTELIKSLINQNTFTYISVRSKTPPAYQAVTKVHYNRPSSRAQWRDFRRDTGPIDQ